MNLEQLKTFIILYDIGSFSKAEKTASMSKQSMYKQIDNLENEIGCQLFERDRMGIHPTPAANVLYARAKDILSDWNMAMADCRKAVHKEFIRIGSIEHQVLLNPVNEVFAREHPDVELRRIVHPEHSGEYRVSHNIMDVGETFVTNTDPYGSIYRFTPLLDMPFLAAMAKTHPLAGKRSLALQELSEYPVVCFPLMLEKAFYGQIQDAFALRPFLLQARDDVDNQVSVAFACGFGNEILITANPFIYSVSSLVTIPLKTKYQRKYGIIYMMPHSPAVEKYIETARRVYRRNPFEKGV